jgi:hypothetical protein
VASHHSFITDEQAALIRNARMFFVATADPHLAQGPNGVGPINLSPKGGVPLHILSPNRVAFLDLSGSGNETARHSLADGPITIAICSFEAENAGIVRLYGRARITPLAISPVAELLTHQAAVEVKLRHRQVVEVEIESTVTSCGYGVPVMAFVRDRRIADRGRRYKDKAGGSSSAPAQPVN